MNTQLMTDLFKRPEVKNKAKSKSPKTLPEIFCVSVFLHSIL